MQKVLPDVVRTFAGSKIERPLVNYVKAELAMMRNHMGPSGKAIQRENGVR